MMDVYFKTVIATGGQTAAQRFAAMTVTGTKTFYIVGDDLYWEDEKLSNASELATAVSNIATNTADIATINGTLTTLQGSESTSGSIRYIIADYLSNLDAADIPIADAGGYFTADDVEGALQELAQASAGGVDSKTVYVTETAGSSSDNFSKKYSIYQGANGSSSSPVAGEKLTDIFIPKDMVVEEGIVVTITYNAGDGKLYDGQTDVTDLIVPSGSSASSSYAGKYIRLTIANATSDKIYISVADLVDVYTAQPNATEVQLAIDSNNVISATIVAVDGSKITAGTVAKAKLAQAVQDSLDLADSAVQSVAEGSTDGTVSVDGTDVAVHGLGSAAFADTTDFEAAGAVATAMAGLADIATSGAAVDASVTDSAGNFSSQTKNVETILAEIASHLTWQEV